MERDGAAVARRAAFMAEGGNSGFLTGSGADDSLRRDCNGTRGLEYNVCWKVGEGLAGRGEWAERPSLVFCWRTC